MKRRGMRQERMDIGGVRFETVTLRNSQLRAKDEFDYRKICQNQLRFLKCSIKKTEKAEEKISAEEVTFVYDVFGKKPWHFLRLEKRRLQLGALIDVSALEEMAKQYSFSLNPQELYYDIQARGYLRVRDVYGEEEEYDSAQFLLQYKALIGCTLSRKYKFEDYYNGGSDLFQEDKFLRKMMDCQSVEETLQVLYQEYEDYETEHRRKYAEVLKKGVRNQKIAIGALSILAGAALSLCGYLGIWERPYEKAVIAANEAYLQSDYMSTVEALAPVKVERMNGFQKYILAVSSVRCENFNEANQQNILNSITLNGNEKVMEYWIYINRLNTDMAEDIAMQLSSNQLLYYAYLKERIVVENDTTMSGEEKKTRLSEIESKLKPLTDEYKSLIGE